MGEARINCGVKANLAGASSGARLLGTNLGEERRALEMEKQRSAKHNSILSPKLLHITS
jgi:hypothetical protein